ncbi:MAG: VWA domain-containing protein [Thermoanaerobaculia bacterium]|nr:VWA domain-containing protein [Thermoanaerobaculia bacterium]
MKVVTQQRSSRSNTLPILVIILTCAASAQATTQLLLSRGDSRETSGLKGIVELAVNPGFDDAKVTITVDGQKIAEGIAAPYRVIVDFGLAALQHKINVVAVSPSKKRVQWTETINRGLLPLSVNVKQIDAVARLFEVVATAPADDPIAIVELWDAGKLIASADQPPYRFTIPAEVVNSGFVQITARTKSGDEAADFWSSGGDVHVESVQVRTVPLFVSVVDRNGTTLDNIDRSLFTILDNGAATKIVEFGKAFDQPISIALLLDASASMTYSLKPAAAAASEFVKRTLKKGDRCAVFAVQDVPRRKQTLTDDLQQVTNALATLTPAGSTSLYDAIESAVRELRDEKVRRAIVVLTDGGDTGSVATFDEAERAASQAGIPIYFIAYNTGGDTLPRDMERLKYLSAQTGGFVAAAGQQDLRDRYHAIERDLRAQFAILYQVTDYGKANEWRNVRVMLSSPTLTARTIRGYFAP